MQELLADLANVGVYAEAYRELGSDSGVAPFGRIGRQSAEEARAVLRELLPHVRDKEAIDEKTRNAFFQGKEGYKVSRGAGRREHTKKSVLVHTMLRELILVGLAVNDHDEDGRGDC